MVEVDVLDEEGFWAKQRSVSDVNVLDGGDLMVEYAGGFVLYASGAWRVVKAVDANE